MDLQVPTNDADDPAAGGSAREGARPGETILLQRDLAEARERVEALESTRQHLKRILKYYPDTEYGEKAQELLNALDKEP